MGDAEAAALPLDAGEAPTAGHDPRGSIFARFEWQRRRLAVPHQPGSLPRIVARRRYS